MHFHIPLLVSAALASSCQDYTGPDTTPPVTSVTIQVDSTRTFQTWRAWSARALTDLPSSVRNGIITAAVQDLGVTGIGVEARFKAGRENPGLVGWDSVSTMTFVNNWVLPFKQKVGSDFHFRIRAEGEPADHQEIARVLNALKAKGLVPDEWVELNEPDLRHNPAFSAPVLADSGVSNCLVIRQAGAATKLSAPASSTVSSSNSYAQVLANDSRLTGCLGDLTFHMYGGVTTDGLSQIGNLSRQTGIPSSMDEHHGAAITELFDAIEFANVSLWQRDGFGGTGCSTCYSLYSSPGGNNWFLAGNTGFYRQFYRAIRPGMVRWQATSSVPNDRVVAFGGAGKAAVVVRSVAGDTVVVQGLPAGSYEIFYTLGNGKWTGAGSRSPNAVTLPTVSIAAGEDLKTVIPDTGVITARRIG
ncbi:MAG TPA: hypothetical protein VGP80_17205 [Gemmatimonadales bacterium]|nr:hypothetical protein [Gemmatimonadales bacterium]